MANTLQGTTILLDTAGSANYVTIEGPVKPADSSFRVQSITLHNDSGVSATVEVFSGDPDGSNFTRFEVFEIGANTTVQRIYPFGVQAGSVYATGVSASVVALLNLV